MVRFNPPPGWPPVPEGWLPPQGWAPDPAWPDAPPGWSFYTDAARPLHRRFSPVVLVVAATVAVLLVVATVSVVSSVTGHETFEITVDDFAYSVQVTGTDRPTAVNGLIAKPGFSFIEVQVEVTNLQDDRIAPFVNGVQALAAPPDLIRVSSPTWLGGRSCDVRGAGAGEVSTGVAGAPPGWCFFTVTRDDSGSSGVGALEAGATVEQTFHSTEAFPSDVDAGLFRVYGSTGGGTSTRGQDLDLGEAG